MHILACFWHSIQDLTQDWIPPTNFIEAGNPDKIYKYYYDTTRSSTSYLLVFYYAVATLGANEMGARSEYQLIATIVVCIVGKIFFDLF